MGGGHVARMRNRTGAYRVLMGRPNGKGLLVRSRRRWKGACSTTGRQNRCIQGFDGET
jgi:hypothetical protein